MLTHLIITLKNIYKNNHIHKQYNIKNLFNKA